MYPRDTPTPSSNAVIAGRSNIPHNVSDTTWDESVTTVGTLNKLVDEHTNDQCTRDSREVTDTVVKSAIDKGDGESNGDVSAKQEYCEVTVEKKLPMNPHVTDNQSTMEMSTHSMGTDKSSYKESDGATSESRETNMSLQYLTDEGTNNKFYTIYNSLRSVTQSQYFLDIQIWKSRKVFGIEVFCDCFRCTEIINCEKYCKKYFNCRMCTNGDMPISTQRRGEY